MTRDDPFDDIFREFERMVNDLFGVDDEPSLDGGKDARVDVQEFEDRVEVIADLPGVSADDVDLRCDGRILRVQAGRYDQQVELPVIVDETSADASFNNGVLSVTFERAADGGATIDLA